MRTVKTLLTVSALVAPGIQLSMGGEALTQEQNPVGSQPAVALKRRLTVNKKHCIVLQEMLSASYLRCRYGIGFQGDLVRRSS